MSDLDALNALAADYVLGQLTPVEREEAQARLAGDPAFAAAVAAWEQRLAPLGELAPDVAPPAHLLPAVLARIGAGAGVPGGEGAGRGGDAAVIDLTRRLRRWQIGAGLAGALAASLAVVVLARELTRSPATPMQFVAVLQKDASSPAFVMTLDLAKHSFMVRAVGAPSMPDHSYELWLVSDRLPQPKSLGLVGAEGVAPVAMPRGYDPAMLSRATYAITLEPPGGSPTGVATGPVLFAGQLMRVSP